MLDIESLKCFVKQEIDKQNRPDYNFRSRYTHSLRVMRWAEVLQFKLGGSLEVLRIAALLHDVGWEEGINHADVSYRIAKEYLSNYEIENKTKILEAVLFHNRRDTQGLNLETYIIMDADILDEVGATTIIWDTLSSACSEDSSYYSALKRMKKYAANTYKQIDRFHFQESREIFKTRIKVIDDFIKELSYELGENV